MREDRRRRYDDGFRREALELIKSGAGKDTLARRLAIPVYTARNWIRLYRSNGEEAVMGGNGSRRYDWETKVTAAREQELAEQVAYLKAKVAYLENSGPCGRPSHAAQAKRRRPTARRAGTPARPPPEDSRAAAIHVLPSPVAPGARVQTEIRLPASTIRSWVKRGGLRYDADGRLSLSELVPLLKRRAV